MSTAPSERYADPTTPTDDPPEYDTHVKISEAVRLFPENPSRQLVYNWATRGCFGVILKTRRQGSRYFTTQRWVDEFEQELLRHGRQSGRRIARRERLRAAKKRLANQ